MIVTPALVSSVYFLASVGRAMYFVLPSAFTPEAYISSFGCLPILVSAAHTVSPEGNTYFVELSRVTLGSGTRDLAMVLNSVVVLSP